MCLVSGHRVCLIWGSLQKLIIMENTGKVGKEVINSVSFNQDRSFAALATSIGFKIYSMNPFSLRHQRDFGTPLQFVELVGKTNLIGLVGEQETPFTPPNRLAIFDDKTQKIIADMTFASKIKQLKIRLNKIVVALHNKVFLIDLFKFETEYVIETYKFEQNEVYNMISLSSSITNFILAVPSVDLGHMSLIYLGKLTERKVRAHQSILSAALMTQNGEKLATTSEKGIQVRIFNTRNGQLIQQVRRGNEYATIYSLAFSTEGNWLAVSSDSNNMHVFAVQPTEIEKERQYKKNAEKERKNPKSSFFFLKGLFPFFDAEYSFCYHKYEQYRPEMKTWLSFGNYDDNLVSISNFQYFEKVELNLKGGKCRTIEKCAEILGKELMEKKK